MKSIIRTKDEELAAISERCSGPREFENFDKSLGGLLAIPRAEMERREAAYKAKAALNPHKRGPKPKSSVSPAPEERPEA